MSQKFEVNPMSAVQATGAEIARRVHGGRYSAGRTRPQVSLLHAPDARSGRPHRAQTLPSRQSVGRRLCGPRAGGHPGRQRARRPPRGRALPFAPRHGRLLRPRRLRPARLSPVPGPRRRTDPRPRWQHAHGRYERERGLHHQRPRRHRPRSRGRRARHALPGEFPASPSAISATAPPAAAIGTKASTSPASRNCP